MSEKRDKIFELLRTKTCVKQEVFAKTKETFLTLKEVLKDLSSDYKSYISKYDDRVVIEYEEEGYYGAHLKFGGDLLIFQMHSNVFTFPPTHPILQSSYVKKDSNRAYCGVIYIYNFLNDSFKYNRDNDYGYLVSRVFVNKDLHFFTEGKGELNYRYFDFANQVISREGWVSVVESAVEFSLKFDLYTPPFTKSQLVTVAQMKQLSSNMKVRTGKRLGFRMSNDKGDVI